MMRAVLCRLAPGFIRKEARAASARMSSVPGPAWTAAEMDDAQAQWCKALSPTINAELAAAAASVRSKPLQTVTMADISCVTPELQALASELLDGLTTGCGVAVLKGMNITGLSRAEVMARYAILGLHLGTAVPQNAHGHLIGHVCDHHEDPDDPAVRVYRTPQRQRFHTDSADVVGLLCLSTAASGGVSAVASSLAIYDRLAATDPAAVSVLESELAWDRKGEIPAGKAPYYLGPVFNPHRGKMLTIYDRKFFETAARFDGVAPLTDAQIRALDAFEALAESDEFRLDMELEVGDVQLLHNHQILHARSAFVDAPPTATRHLLRLWLSLPAGRGWELPPAYAAGRYASVDRAAGPVGGILAEGGAAPTYPLEPE